MYELFSAGNNLHIWLYIQRLTLAGILNRRLSTDLLVKSANLILTRFSFVGETKLNKN